MKSYIKCFRIIVFVAVIGFLSVACKEDSLDGTGWNTTYNGVKVFLRFHSPNFTLSAGGETFAEGTYSVSDIIVSMSMVTVDFTTTGTLAGNILTVTVGDETIRFTKRHRIFGGQINYGAMRRD